MRSELLYLTIAISSFSAAARNISDVVAEIESNNIELKAIQASNKAALAEIKTENVLDATSIEYSPFFHKEITGVASSELIVSQEFDFPSLYVERGKSQRMQSDLFDSQYAVSSRELRQNVWSECLDIVRLTHSINLLRSRIAVNDSIWTLYDRRLKRGDATVLDIKRIELDRMQLNTELVKLSSEQQTVVSNLITLNGGKDLNLDNLVYPMNLNPDAVYTDDVELAVADKEVKLAGQELKISKQGWIPKITLGYRRNTEGGDASNGFLVGLSLPIFSNSSNVKLSEAKAAEARLRRDETFARVKSETDARLNTVKSMQQTLNSYNPELIDEMIGLLKKSLMLGNMSLVDYYIEVAGLYEKMQTYIDIENDYYKALVQLNQNSL